MRDARVHDGRHTAATTLLLLGADARTVMAIMEWSDVWPFCHRACHHGPTKIEKGLTSITGYQALTCRTTVEPPDRIELSTCSLRVNRSAV